MSAEELADLESNILSAEERSSLEKKLKNRLEALDTAGIEWFPKSLSEVEDLEKEADEIHAALEYDDILRDRYLEETTSLQEELE